MVTGAAERLTLPFTTLSTVWLLWAGILLTVGVSSRSVC